MSYNPAVQAALAKNGLVTESDDVVVDLNGFDADAIISEMAAELGLPIVEASDPEQMAKFEAALKQHQDRGQRGAAPVDRMKQNLARVLRSGHFLIMSPARGLSFADKQPQSDKDRTIASKDEEAVRRVFADNPQYMRGAKADTPKAQRSKYNRASWWDLRRKLKQMGFKPILATGLYQEEGMDAPSNEPSLIISPMLTTGDEQPELTLPFAKRLSQRYNQDAFIYSGPENDESVWMYDSDDGRTSYTPSFNMGKAGTISVQDMKEKLSRAGKEEGGVYGATVPTSQQDNPDLPKFGTKQGKGNIAVDIE